MKRALSTLSIVLLLTAVLFFKDHIAHAADQALHGPYTIAERLQEYGETVDKRWAPDFARANVAYPPSHLTLLVLKEERVLQVYAAGLDGQEHFIRSYPIQAASGHLGPKLREGDRQVPEGIYAVESLNPNSAYHLALHVNYPNAFDRAKAKLDGRSRLGANIMIHGSDVSIGCVAMGDQAAEDLFVLTAKTGLKQTRLVFSPVDFRTGAQVPNDPSLPVWKDELYANIKAALSQLPSPAPH